MKTQLLCWGDPTTNNFVDRPSIFKPLRFLLLFLMFGLVAQVGFGATDKPSGGKPRVVKIARTIPTIITQPASVAVTYGLPATFTVTASGIGLTYQWEEGTSASGPWTTLNNVAPYSGTTTATLTLTKPSVALSSRFYRCTVTESSSGDAITTDETSQLTVNKKTLTTTGASVTSPITYNGSAAATITGATLVGIISPDVVNISNLGVSGSGTFADANWGVGKSVTAVLTLGGAAAGNYMLTQPTGLTGTIDKKVLTVIGAVVTSPKTYNGNDVALITGALLSGVVFPDVVSVSGGGTYADANVGTAKPVTAALVLGGGGAGNYTLTQPTGLSGDIVVKALTVTGAVVTSPKTYNGNDVAFITGALLSGVVSPDVVSVSGGGTYADANVGTAKPVTAALVLGGGGAGNYTLTQPTGLSGDIVTKVLTPSITASNKLYDGSQTANLLTQTVATVVSGETVTLIVGTSVFDTKNVGTGKTVTATGLTLGGGDAGNYVLSATTATTTANITAILLTVIANNQVACQNATFTFLGTEFTSPTTPLPLSEAVAGVTLTFSAGTATAGTFPIVPSAATGTGGFMASNYNITYTDGTFTVNPAASTALAGSDVTICPSTPTTLTGNFPTVGTGTWTLITSTGQTGTFSNINLGTSTFTPLSGVGVYKLRWSILASPNCNPNSDDVEITSLDVTKPVITASSLPTITVNANTGVCSADLVTVTGNTNYKSAAAANLAKATYATDNCAVNLISNDFGSLIFPLSVGTHKITWTVTDFGGNTSLPYEQMIVVVDNQAPVNTLPTLANPYNVDAGLCTASLSLPATATDNCSVTSIVYKVGATVITFPYLFPKGSTIVEATSSDAAGNTDADTYTVIVVDNQAPINTLPTLAATYNVGAGLCTASLSLPVTATDNCSVTSIVYEVAGSPITFPYLFPKGSTTVKATSSDGTNTDIDTYVVVVVDNQAPVNTLPTLAATYNAGASCTASLSLPVTATDNCSVTSIVYKVGATVITFPYLFPKGSTIVEATSSDAAGNTDVDTYTVVVVDNQAPVNTLPTIAATYDTDATLCTASLSLPVTATDNCSVTSIVYEVSGSPITFPYLFPKGSTTVKATSSDGTNTDVDTYVVNVIDAEKPKFTLTTLAPINVNADAGVCTYASSQLTVPATTDNCTSPVVAVASPASLVAGPNNVTWTVTDAAGNAEIKIQVVTVVDAEKPKFTLATLTGINVNADANTCTYASNQLIPPSTTDNCTASVVAVASPASLVAGANTVTWTVTDNAGNVETKQQVVTVVDTQKPKFTLLSLAGVTVSADAGVCTYLSSQLTPPATTDNCTSPVVAIASPASLVAGANNVTWTVTDAAGNVETKIQVVTVVDAEKPKFTLATLPAISKNADAGVCTYASSQLTPPATTDNCTSPTLAVASPASLVAGANNVLWTVIDAAGNSESKTQVVTVVDTQNPTFTFVPAALTVPANNAGCTALTSTVTLGTATATDNCGTANITNNAPVAFPIGNTTVIWTVTDGAGLTATATQTVTVTNPITLPTPTITQVIGCNGGFNGSLTATATGGSGFTYAWTGPNAYASTGANVNGLGAGTYNVTATASTGCTATASIVLTEPAALTFSLTKSSYNGADISCDNSTDGTVTVASPVGTGLVSTYQYQIRPFGGTFGAFQTNATFTGLAAGKYEARFKDQNACISIIKDITLVAPTVVVLTANGTDVTCNGANDGKITASATGGTLPYVFAYKLTSASSYTTGTSPITGLAPGTYDVKVTDANGCMKTAQIIIIQPAALTATTTQVDVKCFGASTGSVNLTVAGGNTPYAYAWTGVGGFASSIKDISSLSAGAYSVTITDAKSCTATATVNVMQPTAAIAITSTATNVGCFGASTGAINLGVTGGTTAYAYVWTGPASFTGATTKDITSLSAGTYNVTVTDNNLCVATASVTVTQPTAGLTLNTTPTNIACFGGTTGAIDLAVTGGTSPNTYAWTGPGTFTAATEDISSLAFGTYSVIVTDANSCSAAVTVTLTQPTAGVTTTATATAVACFGDATGAVNLATAGGTSPYTYSWAGTGGFTATTQNISSLTADTYMVTVLDANGCTATAVATVSQPNAALVLSTTAITNVSCNGGSNGSVTFGVTGGTSPWGFSYKLSTATTFTTAIIPPLTGLSAGTYDLKVVDANNCEKMITFTITEPTAINVIATGVPLIGCAGSQTGVINTTVTGGTGAKTYLWSGPSGYTSTMASPTTLFAGTYNLVVTDANSCTATASVTLIDPPAITLSSVKTDVKCNAGSDGTITVTVTNAGPTDKYRFKIDGGSFVPTLTIASPYTFTGLSAGLHSIDVQNAAGCVFSGNNPGDELKVTLTAPTALVANASKVDVTCVGGNTGTATAAPTGGTLPYTYAWTGAASFTSTTQNLTALTAGTYNVTVTDANSCVATASVIVGETNALPTVTVLPTTVILTCANSTASIIASGADTYSWSGPASFTTATASISLTGTYIVTGTSTAGCTATASVVITEDKLAPTVTASSAIAILTCATPTTTITAGGADTYSWTGPNSFSASTMAATITEGGTYTVIGTSTANGCTAMAIVSVTENKATPTMTVTPTASVLTCANPTTTITASGADTYSWTRAGGGFTSTMATASITTAGTYTVIGTNTASGCTASASVVITEDKVTPTVTVLPTTAILTCASPTTSITASGADTYSWSDGASFSSTTNPVSISATGTYTVVGTSSANGCTAMATVVITGNTIAPTIVVTPTTAVLSCTIPTTTITASGADSYSWTGTGAFTANTVDAIISAAGTYTVVGTSTANGCTASASVVITETNVTPTATITGSLTVCANSPISLTGTGGGTYQWSGPNNFSATTSAINIANATATEAGVYMLTVLSSTGCTATASATVTVNTTIAVPTITPPAAPITAGSSITLTATGCSGTVKWYRVIGGAEVTMPVTNVLFNTSIVAKCETAAGCLSDASSSVEVIVTDSFVFSVVTGDWENPATWSTGRVPTVFNHAIISANHTVTVNDATPTAKKVELQAASILNYATGAPTAKLTLGSL